MVAHYHACPTMHAPCTLRLTLTNISARQFDGHESFDHTRRIAVKRCSTSASMCGSRAAQRDQRSGNGEGRDCSPPRDGRGALTSTLGTLEQAQRPVSASPGDLLLVLDAPRQGPIIWSFGWDVYAFTNAYRQGPGARV